MNLDPQSKFPTARCYVLKLHRDALPEGGRLFGRLENLVTGDQREFNSSAELLALLAADLMAARPNFDQESI